MYGLDGQIHCRSMALRTIFLGGSALLVLSYLGAQAHAQVEAILALHDPELSQSRLQAVLERFFGFWQGTERVIDEWAAREPEFAAAARWQRSSLEPAGGRRCRPGRVGGPGRRR